MNISKHILVGACVLFGLASCANEDFLKMGSVSLTVDKKAPATRSVETADYPVAIYTAYDNKMIASYEKASLVPTRMKLAVGEYYAEAHAPGEMDKIMSAPYYAGREDFQILQNVNTEPTIICRMANGCIEVNYSEEFISAFTDWTITVDDGGQSAIMYTRNEDGLTPAPLYIRWEEGVKTLYVNFKGTTVAGNLISTNNMLTKQQASEKYDSDTDYFAGGDRIVINFDPVENTEGEVASIVIRANISFEESEEDFKMEVEDFVPEDTGDEDEPTGGDSNAITLNLPEDMTVTFTTDPSLGDTYIAAEHGIKSISVKVESTSADMMSELERLISDYGVDFVNGAEVVENQDMVNLFLDLDQVLEVPTKGDTEYTFPIGNFFGFLAILPGEHTFTMVVTDMEGNTKNGQLTLTVE